MKVICYDLTREPKMAHYWFNRQKLLQKAKDRYLNGGGKEKAYKHYIANKHVLTEKARNKYINLSEEGKEAKRKYQRNRCRNMKPAKKVSNS